MNRALIYLGLVRDPANQKMMRVPMYGWFAIGLAIAAAAHYL